jgi:hypothetical protein
MVAVRTADTSDNANEITRRYVPEGSIFITGTIPLNAITWFHGVITLPYFTAEKNMQTVLEKERKK